ncbi:uncharacterized protein [Porites lutea]|uniref:uncharacterized protein n=1 Tax=Porites lutea TaxID=51062 RepID=UPI003CC5CF49
MAGKFNVKFYPLNSEMDSVSFEESLDPYSAFRKASEDSTVPDQPLWGILVWQVVGIFLLGFIFVCAVSCYCCERYSVRIPKIKKPIPVTGDEQETCTPLTDADFGDWRMKKAESETDY